MARLTKRDKALQLLKTAMRGPAFDERKDPFQVYRTWSTTWLLPAMRDLIPELKNVALPPLGTREPDPYWKDRGFTASNAALSPPDGNGAA